MSCLKIVKVMVAALLGIGVFLFGAATSAQAQKKFSIGSLNTADQLIDNFEGFHARMAELGYRDGQNVGYQYYNSPGADELLKSLAQKLAPKACQVAMPVDVHSVNLAANEQEVAEAAARFGFKVAELKVASPEELEKLAAAIQRKNFDAIFTPADSMVSNGIDALAKGAMTERLPLIPSLLVLVKRGALASYAADHSALGSQGAVLADKILRGARPASLPIELPRKFKLAINLKTAKSIDLRIAKELLLRADDVID